LQCSEYRCTYDAIADPKYCAWHAKVNSGLIVDVPDHDGKPRLLKPKAAEPRPPRKTREPKLRYCAEPMCLEKSYDRKCRRHQ
jgi:hypothetical protein